MLHYHNIWYNDFKVIQIEGDLRMKKIYVLDTNVLIQAPHALKCFDDNEVVLPLVVLEELDAHKRDEGERGANVREAIRILEQIRGTGDLVAGIKLDNGGVLISDSKGQFCALTKRLLKYIGDDEIIHTDSIGGRVFININRPVAMLQRM